MNYETIVVDTPAEHVARITLNRPEKRNAISTTMRVELLDALRTHDHDPGCGRPLSGGRVSVSRPGTTWPVVR